MKNSIRFLRFASALLALCLAAPSLFAACPDCYLDNKAMKSHGTSTNGRPIVKVKLTGDWNVSPGQSDPRMFNAVRDAVNNWNSAVDPSTGRGAFYEMSFNSETQNADDNAVNIRITKLPAGSQEVAHIQGPVGGPYNIKIPADAVEKCSPEALLEVVRHEVGHTMGLAHLRTGVGLCRGNEASVMDAPNRADAPCTTMGRSIQPRDVQGTICVDDPTCKRENCKSIGQGRGGGNLATPTPTPEPSPTQGGGGCYNEQFFDSVYVSEGCWHEYWTVMTFCEGRLVYLSVADLDVHCY